MKQREIKFRAWDGTFMINPYCDLREHNQFWGEDLTNTPYKSPISVMQFTGIHDKNGKEIYEGDIVRIAAGNPSWTADPFEVVFMNGAFQIKKPYFQAATSFSSYLSECLSHDVITDNSDYSWLFEVIGNIHQNPELLK